MERFKSCSRWCCMMTGQCCGCCDESGSVAIETGLIMPVLVLLAVGSMQIGFMFEQWQATSYAAQACATAAARANEKGNDAQGAGTSTVNANQKQLLNGASFGTPSIQVTGQSVSCSVTASGSLPVRFIPGVADPFVTSASATD